MRGIVTQVALIVSALTTGLFAGLLWTFAIGVDPMLARLDGPGYTLAMQTLIYTIDVGIPWVLVPASVAPLVALVLLGRAWRSPVFLLTLAAFLAFVFGVMVFTVVLNVPINNYVLTWNVQAPPADWAAARARWDQLNSIRTPISVLSFLAYLIALLLPLPATIGQAAWLRTRARSAAD